MGSREVVCAGCGAATWISTRSRRLRTGTDRPFNASEAHLVDTVAEGQSGNSIVGVDAKIPGAETPGILAVRLYRSGSWARPSG